MSSSVTVLVRRYIPQSSGPLITRAWIPLGLKLFAGLVTPGALVGWVYFLEPHVSDLTKLIPDAHIGMLIFGGALFALVTAAFEEISLGIESMCRALPAFTRTGRTLFEAPQN